MVDIAEFDIGSFIEQNHLFPASGRVVVAVSGGSDSFCLLHLLHLLCGPGKRYPHVQLYVAHLDHQLRGGISAQEATYVARLAEGWGLPVTIGVIDVPALARQEHRSLEDAARTARYRFLREVAEGSPIAVAHHADDQVETLLLHWLRGGGIASQPGLQPRQQDIIRPLLPITHADTLAYCQQHNIIPLEDASNTDPRFLRNRIRHELLPLLETMNSGIRHTVLRNAEVIHADVAWVEEQVDVSWSIVVISEQEQRIFVRRSALLALPLSLQRHLLRRVTARLCDGQSPLELRHYKLIEELLRRDSGERELVQHLPQHLHLTRTGEELLFEHVGKDIIQYAQESENKEVTLPIPGQVALPGTEWLATAKILPDEIVRPVQEALLRDDWTTIQQYLTVLPYTVYIDGGGIELSLQVRTRRPGDRIRPLGMAHEKKVQDILIDKHVARSARASIPLFFSDAHCVWLAGMCIDDRVRLTPETQRIIHLSIHSSG